MKNQTYTLSKKYVAAETRSPIHGAIASTVFLGLIIYAITWRSPVATAVGLGIAALAGGVMLLKNLRLSRRRASILPKLSVVLSPDELRVEEIDHRMTIPTASIASVSIDSRGGAPRVVYIRTVEGGTLQLQGLERFPDFSRDLSNIVGRNKVREMKWWQFPPS
jgi:hypothetical protein